MATRRKRPVLYEVMRRSHPHDPGARQPTAPTTAGAAPSSVSPPESASGAEPRTIRIVGGRLYAELGWPALGVLVIGAAFILWVTFQAGVRYARSHSPTENAANTPAAVVDPTNVGTPDDLSADHRPADGQRVATPAEAGREPPAQPAAEEETARKEPAFEFQPGRHYVVIQHFYKSQQAEALDACQYLRAAGVSCVVMPRSRDVELIATAPFLLRQDDAGARAAERRRCDALKQRIKQIGKEYGREHGYAFDQCYERLLIK